MSGYIGTGAVDKRYISNIGVDEHDNINYYDITPANYNDFAGGADANWSTFCAVTKAVDGDAMKFTWDGVCPSSGYIFLRQTKGLAADLYKIEYRVTITGKSDVGSPLLSVWDGSAYTDADSPMTATYQTFTIVFTAGSTTGCSLQITSVTGGNQWVKDMIVEIRLYKVLVDHDLNGYSGKNLLNIYTLKDGAEYYHSRIGLDYDMAAIVYKDIYRLLDTELSSLATGVFVGSGNYLLEDAEHGCVYKRSPKADFTGGSHGDELKTSVVLTLDGVDISADLVGDFDFKTGEILILNQNSTMHETSNDGINPIPGHPLEANHEKIITINRFAIKQSNTLSWQTNLADLVRGYVSMAGVSADYINFVEDELGNEADLSVGDDAFKLNSNGKSAFYSNTGTDNKVRVVGGTDYNNSNALMFVWNRAAYKKYYLDVVANGAYPNVTSGDEWNSTTQIKFTIP